MRAFGKLAMVSGATLLVSGLECTRHIELMILQDASTSFYELGEDMANKVETLIDSLNDQIGTVEASLAVWSDKPVPFRGVGYTRGVPEHLTRQT
ncbi:hypothetical protein GNI_135510 [Gregarina niphandrodes]|uniref:Transmembrane protein n=1 Tax=Gregarina niphandrodes TaxID=110365 RepID=A0A023B1I4_GRENI|nr:hypothetical protein GNI_135510 [Gregarina niphandrodes]EZG46051.1 hypothetical protein GNI_135510 [Gregarina niphandrodes]|eukprot:XP_011132382.1 hypothetical protein GNI_135510 [Gregarina niphandrodes]